MAVSAVFDIYIPICFYFNGHKVLSQDKWDEIYIPICFYFNKLTPLQYSIILSFTFQYVSILIRFQISNNHGHVKFTFQYVSILILAAVTGNNNGALFTFQYVSILINFRPHLCEELFSFTFQYVSILIMRMLVAVMAPVSFTFQYVSILIHHPNSRFFSTLFPHFLLTSQSLQIFYYISFINSTKEKQNHLFFTLVEFCRCTGIFTLSEVDSLKIVVME